eukprot:826408-Alexandrium_andersonii.AAC.1
MHFPGASGAILRAVSGSAQFKLRIPPATSHVVLGSGRSKQLCGAPGSSGNLRRAWVLASYSTYSV